MRDKITADFTLGCKRIIFSNEYYPAIKQKNVDVVASALSEVQGSKVIACNGESADVDAIIFGTGFEITPPPIASKVLSSDGLSLAERWKTEGPQAYLGTTIYDMPNAFFMVGPNILVYSSFIEIAEWQAAYIVDAIATLQNRGIHKFNLLKQVSDEYNQRVQTLLTDTVWNSGGCESYYLGEGGRNVASWPWAIPKLKQKLSCFDLVNYQISR